MDIPIKNIDDLRSEITRLKGLEVDQSIAIGERFKSFTSVFSTVYSLFPKFGGGSSKSKGFFEQDLAGLISRFVLPFTLNRTIFRHSNFLIKTIVGLVSQKASNFITEDTVVSAWDKVKALFAKKERPHKPRVHKTIAPVVEVQ